MHSPARRAAKALAALVVAAGLVLAAAPPGRAASTGEGATVKQILSEKLPNVPGKTLTVVEVDYRPGGVRLHLYAVACSAIHTCLGPAGD